MRQRWQPARLPVVSGRIHDESGEATDDQVDETLDDASDDFFGDDLFGGDFFRGLVERSPDPYVVVDRAGVIRWASESAAKLVGRSHDDYVGRHIADLVTPAALPAAIEAFDEYTSRPAGDTGWVGPPMLLELLHRDGRAVPVAVRQVPTAEPFPGLALHVSTDTSVQALYTTIELIAADAALDDVLESIVTLIGVESPYSVAAIGRGWDGERFRHVVASSMAPRLDGDPLPRVPEGRSPWHARLTTGDAGTDQSLDSVDPALRDAAEAAGLVACWVFPVTLDAAIEDASYPGRTGHEATAAIVLWRRATGSPRPNVARRIERIVGLVGLALRTEASHRRLREAARIDSVTGLPNRVALTEHFEQLARRPTGDAVGVLFCDLDRFKDVNDEFGHPTGDRVLAIAADRLRSRLRAGDVLARIGGDEFVVVSCATDRDVIASLADRLVAALDEPITLGDVSVQLGVSVGVATTTDTELAATSVSGDELVERADAALLRAKGAGRHRVVWAA